MHAVDPFVRPSLTPELLYWRLHGNKTHYARYTDDELRQIIAWLPADPAIEANAVQVRELAEPLSVTVVASASSVTVVVAVLVVVSASKLPPVVPLMPTVRVWLPCT